MSRTNRRDILIPQEVQVVHCRSRTVRQAFLCGYDKETGVNYEHRRQWIEDLTIELLKYFALELSSMAIMTNHIHHVLRTRPDLVATWSDREVARRWLGICPKRRDKNERAKEPTQAEIDEILNEKGKVEKLRERLSSVSWFNSRLKERIAKG